MTVKSWTRYAQRKLKNKNWHPWRFERAVGGIIMTGAEMPLTRTGRLNLKQRKKSTECKVIFPIKD